MPASRTQYTVFVIAIGLAANVLIVPAAAQKSPLLGYAFPPAISIGQSTEVQLGGFDFTPDMQWFVHDDRVRLEILGPPGEHHVPPPPYWTGPRVSTPALPIPRETRGRIAVDKAAPEGFVRWQVANANGSSSTAMLYLSRGREIVESRVADRPQRLDSLPVAVSGRLGRLTEVDRYELVAERDGLVSVDLMARRLGSDFNGAIEVRDAAGKMLVDYADTLGVDGGVTFAASKGHAYTVGLHDTDFRGDRAYVYRLALTYGPRAVAAIGNNTLKETSRPTDAVVEVAVDVTSRLPLDAGEHRHTWRVEKDEYWSIAAQSFAIGGGIDVALAVVDAEGKPIGENDDAGGTTDAAYSFRAATAGDYTCIVRAMSTRVGADDEIYRLQIVRQVPDFSLSVPQQINLPSGGTSELVVTATRTGGFAGPIRLAIDGLPDGVTIEGDPTIPADKNEAKLTLVSAKDAAVVATAIRIRGTAEIDGKQVTRTASAVAAGNLCPRTDDERRTTQVLLAITMTPPFELRLVDHERQRAVNRGTTYRAEFEIVRQNGFTGEVRLEMAAQQARYRQGIRGGTVTVSADADRALYPCFMPEWLPTDLTRRMLVNAVAAVPDPQGRPRYLVQPASGRITMILEGALLKLTAAIKEPTLRPGGTLDVPVVIARSSKLALPVTVELVVPDEFAGTLRAEPLVLAPGQDRGTLRIAADAAAMLDGDWPLTLTATALEEEKWPVVSQAEITVRFPSH
ncbi:MAG: hypothetical protein WD875_01295 [Pirellulales bacterium]